jgi:predicted HD superfamily hydrolase involved in NAD metabolism
MYESEEVKARIQSVLKPERYAHSLRVADMAVLLAKHYDVNPDRAYIAGLLHDCGKYMDGKALIVFCKSKNLKIDSTMKVVPELLHTIVSAFIAKEEYGCIDKDVLLAIENHTLGRKDMNILEKIVFVADFCEEGRNSDGAKLVRKNALNNIDRAMVDAINLKLEHLMRKDSIIHPRILDARNQILSDIV